MDLVKQIDKIVAEIPVDKNFKVCIVLRPIGEYQAYDLNSAPEELRGTPDTLLERIRAVIEDNDTGNLNDAWPPRAENLVHWRAIVLMHLDALYAVLDSLKESCNPLANAIMDMRRQGGSLESNKEDDSVGSDEFFEDHRDFRIWSRAMLDLLNVLYWSTRDFEACALDLDCSLRHVKIKGVSH